MHFSRDRHMANMCMKRCSAPLIMGEMKSKPQPNQIKTTNHPTPARRAGIAKSEWVRVRGKGTPRALEVLTQTGAATAESSVEGPPKAGHRTALWPSDPTPGCASGGSGSRLGGACTVYSSRDRGPSQCLWMDAHVTCGSHTQWQSALNGNSSTSNTNAPAGHAK